MTLKPGEKLRCPKCGGNRFIATAHVTQDWTLDENGTFESCIAECTEVTHEPDTEDILVCQACGHDAPGQEFIINEENREGAGDVQIQ